MRIRTQILAVLVVFALITVVVSVLMISTNQELERLNRQGEIAESIALEVGDLGYLSNDYILYREPPQAERWQVQYATISDLIGRLSVDRPEQRTIADNLGVNLRNTRTVFEDIQSSPVPAGGTTTASVQLFWSRMAVQNQGMIFDAGRLEQLLQEEADGLKQTRNLLIVILTGMFVALLLTSYLLFYRRTIESINGLQAGAAIVGSGNLTHVIDESADDEIGDLARAFNRMTRSLNSVTASKVDLEREVAERIQAEVALRESEGRLKGLYSSMSEGLADHQVVYENGKAVDYRITDVNPAYEKITGLSRSRVVGGRASEVYGTGSPPYLDTYAQVASGGTPEHFETYFPHMGKHFAISVFSPEPGRFATVFTDVTERKQAEERIRVSAERLEMAQRAAHAGFWTWEIPTGKLTWTDELYRLFGLSPAGGASFDTWLAIMHPDDREHAMARVNRAIEEKTFLVNEYRIRIPEGTERWIGAWGSTVYDTSGTPLRMSGICLDITDRKRAEEQIAHLASFPELNPNPVMELNLAGEVVYANPAVARILDHMGLTDPGVFLPGDIGEMHPRLMEGDVRKEVQVGDRMFLETISFAPTTRTYRIYARDITDRILAEKALRESELRYRTVADNTSDWEFWADPEGRFIYCSPSCERITGHPAGEFLADPSLSGNLVHPDDRAMWETHVQEEKERQTEDTGVWRLRHPDGSWRWIHHVCQPVYGDGGKFLGTRGSNRDITERVLAEEALRETSQYLENLINHANAPIIVWDPQFLITRFNHAFER
ncbi:MAG: PAS domain S-box protein, partial [Methanomicrobiales archaeon]|nr:PAS domain S-box protein [Methanomicrobiales archaeon]